VLRYLNEGSLLWRFVHEIRVEALEHGVVRYDEHRLPAALDLEDERLETVNEILVALAARVPIVERAGL